jgi:hypothetical protein
MYENGVLYTLTYPILSVGEYNNVNPKKHHYFSIIKKVQRVPKKRKK